MQKGDEVETAFKKAKIVFLTTFSKNGEEHSRPMTNFVEDPSEFIWFPTDTKTRKVEDIRANPRVVLTFPSESKGIFYELEGEARLASQEEVDKRWVWWWLYWHPEEADRFWFPKSGKHPERTIIDVKPKSVRKVSGEKMEKLLKNMPHF